MKTNEILIGLISVKELEIKTLQERVRWLESINAEATNVIQDYQIALATAQEEIKKLRFELNKLYAIHDKDKHDIGFNHPHPDKK